MHIPKSYQLIQRLSSSVTILVMILSLLTGTVSTVRAEGTHSGVLFDVHTNMAYANGWPLGATVTLKIDDSENGTGWDFTSAQGTTNGYTVFTIHPPFQIKAGQAVEISDGTRTRSGQYYVIRRHEDHFHSREHRAHERDHVLLARQGQRHQCQRLVECFELHNRTLG